MEEIIQALEAEKVRIQQQLDRIDQMIAVAGGSPPSLGGETRGARKGLKGGKGRLKDAIVAVIQAAGPSGISTKDISAKLGVPSSRLGSWFASTGKRIKKIKRLDRGIYAWQG